MPESNLPTPPTSDMNLIHLLNQAREKITGMPAFVSNYYIGDDLSGKPVSLTELLALSKAHVEETHKART